MRIAPPAHRGPLHHHRHRGERHQLPGALRGRQRGQHVLVHEDRRAGWMAGRMMPAADYLTAQRIRNQLVRETDEILSRYDAVIAPTWPNGAAMREVSEGWPHPGAQRVGAARRRQRSHPAPQLHRQPGGPSGTPPSPAGSTRTGCRCRYRSADLPWTTRPCWIWGWDISGRPTGTCGAGVSLEGVGRRRRAPVSQSRYRRSICGCSTSSSSR